MYTEFFLQNNGSNTGTQVFLGPTFIGKVKL